MAFVGKPKDEQQYGRLMGMIAPEATPSKRVGTEAPTGAVTAGPSAGKSAADFTKVSAASPGSIFQRQLGSADIGGVTRLAEQPLLREAGGEALRVAKEGQEYRQAQAAERAKAPQFQFKGTKDGKEIDYTSDIVGKIAGGQGEYQTAENVLRGKAVETPELNIGDVKEFTPLQALRGGSVESLIRKEATGPYSTGMAGLDALLFAKKGGAAQLSQRGQALRATEQAAADALEKAATEEERGKAKTLAETQKASLTEALKGGVKAREEAYTKAPEGQETKLAKAQRELKEKYEGTREGARKKIETQVSQLKSQEIDKAFQAAYDRAYKQPYIPTEYERSTGQIDPSRAQMMVVQTALADPEYNRIKSLVQGEAGAGLSRLTQQGSIPFAESDLPTLGLQNVIGADEATQYNRLQQLLGGQTLTPETLTAPSVGVNEAAIQAAYQNMLARLGR